MNIFRKKTVFWALSFILGFIFAVWSYIIVKNQSLIYLKQYYEVEFSDFILIALVIPVYTVLVIIYTSEYISYTKILGFGNRKLWIKKLLKANFLISIKYIFTILFPMSIVVFLFSKLARNISNVVYFFFSFVLNITLFYIINIIVVYTKILWNNDIVSLICIVLLVFAPYVFTRTFFRNRMITISDIMTSRYLFDNENYLWMYHELEIIGILILCFISFKIMGYFIKDRDLLWENNKNEL